MPRRKRIIWLTSRILLLTRASMQTGMRANHAMHECANTACVGISTIPRIPHARYAPGQQAPNGYCSHVTTNASHQSSTQAETRTVNTDGSLYHIMNLHIYIYIYTLLVCCVTLIFSAEDGAPATASIECPD